MNNTNNQISITHTYSHNKAIQFLLSNNTVLAEKPTATNGVNTAVQPDLDSDLKDYMVGAGKEVQHPNRDEIVKKCEEAAMRTQRNKNGSHPFPIISVQMFQQITLRYAEPVGSTNQKRNPF
jgi:hypothetical protein